MRMFHVLLDIVPKMAAIAHGFEMMLLLTRRILAEVRSRQHHLSLGPLCGLTILFFTSAWPRMGPMQPTFTFTFAPAFGPFNANPMAETFPRCWIHSFLFHRRPPTLHAHLAHLAA